MTDPDLATQGLIYYLWTHFKESSVPTVRSTPFYCWVDFDPYGIDILLHYRNASKMRDYERVGCAELRWLGVHSSELMQSSVYNRAMPLTEDDERKLQRMIDGNRELSATGELSSWRAELDFMREWRIKAELESILELCSHDAQQLAHYLQHRMTGGHVTHAPC